MLKIWKERVNFFKPIFKLNPTTNITIPGQDYELIS